MIDTDIPNIDIELNKKIATLILKQVEGKDFGTWPEHDFSGEPEIFLDLYKESREHILVECIHCRKDTCRTHGEDCDYLTLDGDHKICNRHVELFSIDPYSLVYILEQIKKDYGPDVAWSLHYYNADRQHKWAMMWFFPGANNDSTYYGDAQHYIEAFCRGALMLYEQHPPKQ